MSNISYPGKMLFLVLALLLLWGSPFTMAAGQDKRERVIFISVAAESEVFWSGIHGLAQAAADDLGVDLTILYSNRNRVTAVNMAREIAGCKDKPDYVIVVGEQQIASRSIPVLAKNGIKVFLFGNLSLKEKIAVGEPRQKYPEYIGKIAIDDYMAGYLTAKAMIEEAIKKGLADNNGAINLLAFEGVRKTSFSSERVRGLQDALKEFPQTRLLQSVPTDWTYAYVQNALPQLLSRYSDKSIAGVWCANSDMAIASSDVLKSLGRTPGEDIILVGTDWDGPAIERVHQGEIIGIAGGHVAAVAWIITLIHDYHHGIDFSKEVYLNKVTMMDRLSSEIFTSSFKGANWNVVNFKTFSKAENPSLQEYDLSFQAILNAINSSSR
jgi:ABC-type sugar transport system substrate-binding protein